MSGEFSPCCFVDRVLTLDPVPTAAAYRDAARRYRSIAEHLLREAGAVGGWVTSFVSDGPVRVSIGESIGRTRTHLAAAGDDMRRVARVCDSRADVCVEYANAVRRFHQLTLVEQLWHGYPIRPAAWAEL